MAPSPTPVATPVAPTPPEVIAKYQEILKSNGITGVSEILVKDSGLQGENMGSVTECVTVKFEDSNMKNLNLFTKKKPDNENFNTFLNEVKAFEKESMFFMKYLPVAREYCKRMGQEQLMEIYPKCYYGDDRFIVFENLILERGFVLLKKEEFLDFNAASIALINLAKHHAIAHAIIQKEGGSQSFFQRFPILNYEAFSAPSARAMIEPAFENGVKTALGMLKKANIHGSEDTIEFLESQKGKVFSKVTSTLDANPDKFLALNHGDYWSNNHMYVKDKDTGKVIGQVAIDFQGVRYVSPGVDLGYLLYTSVKPETRRRHLRQFLLLYLDQLKITANELGHTINLSMEELVAGFCESFNYGFWFGAMLSEIGHEATKDIEYDLNDDSQDMSKVLEMYDKAINKWLDDHPEECRKAAQNVIEQVNEYKRYEKGIVL